ncbi:hypothetical protein GCM10011487_56300 [Steroidobacter agaridevorans]|uniref:SMP-30/Gluconolactonase/LRE-like region domain-containing protein n=1 Tax=Steroidobacter agaridevorans TaxID=2695856 RepID=A0A829YK70_9GAMM|nr:hypothetical protein [Steroidobacter agaridevorans]GFE83630.1 hypothetical protein GCM10011487_56300 [Steroidobacter agaridevorans]
MKAWSSTVAALLWICSLTGAASAAGVSDCPSDERATYVCNVRNAEDLVAIRDSAWVIAGRLTDPPTQGGFYLIDASSGAASPVAPDFKGPKASIYSECPGAPGKDEFAAHGIAIRYGAGSKHELYAVNHNGRESIEIFDLDMSARRPALIWKGCVLVPPAVMPNSVAPVPSGGFVVTSFGIRTDAQTYQKAMAGGISGFVAKWAPGAGWSEVAGTQFSANNGVAVSEDGKRLFVTGWGDRKLHVISLGEIPYTHQAVELGALHPDNIRATPDGRLLIAGQAATPAEIFACTSLPTCEVGFKVLAVDPRSLSVEPLLDESGSRAFGGASAAIMVGNEVWVGTFSGSRIARYRLRE